MNKKKNIEGFAGLNSWPDCRNCNDVKSKYGAGFNIAKSLEEECTKYLNLAENLLNDKIVNDNIKFIEVDNTFKINNYFALKVNSRSFDSIISYNKKIHEVTIGTFDENKIFLENTIIKISNDNNGFRTTIFVDPPPKWNKVKYISSIHDTDYSYKNYINKRNLINNKFMSVIAMEINHKKFIEKDYEKKSKFIRKSILGSKKLIRNIKSEIKDNNENINENNYNLKKTFDKITNTSVKNFNNINNLKNISQNLKKKIKILVDKNNLIAIDIKKKMNQVERLRILNINNIFNDTNSYVIEGFPYRLDCVQPNGTYTRNSWRKDWTDGRPCNSYSRNWKKNECLAIQQCRADNAAADSAAAAAAAEEERKKNICRNLNQNSSIDDINLCNSYSDYVPDGIRDLICRKSDYGLLQRVRDNRQIYQNFCNKDNNKRDFFNSINSICLNCNNLNNSSHQDNCASLLSDSYFNGVPGYPTSGSNPNSYCCSTERIREGGCSKAIECKNKIHGDELKRRLNQIGNGFAANCCENKMADAILDRNNYIMCQFVGRKEYIVNKKESWCKSDEYTNSANNYRNRLACLTAQKDNNDNPMSTYNFDNYHCNGNKNFYSTQRGNLCGLNDYRDRKFCNECNSNNENNYRKLGTNNKINNIDYSSIYVIKNNCPNENTHNNSNDYMGCKWNSNSQYNNPSLNMVDCRCTDDPSYFYSETFLNAKDVESLGKIGIGPWGDKGFPDKDAEWIWNTKGAASGAEGMSAGQISFIYVWNNETSSDISAKINIIVDNKAEIKVNNSDIATQSGGWGGKGGSYSVILRPGKNTFVFDALNMGNSNNPAGLIVSVSDNNDNVLFRTGDIGWKYSLNPEKKKNCKDFKHITDYDFPYKSNDKKVNSRGYDYEDRKIMIDEFVKKIKVYEDELSKYVNRIKNLFDFDKANSYEYKIKHLNDLILLDNQYKELIYRLQNDLLLIKLKLKKTDNKNSIIIKKKINQMIKDDNNLKLLIINNNELKIVVKNLENKLKENYRILKYVSEEVEILNNKKNKKLANYNGNYFKPNNYDIYQEEIV